MTQSLTGNLRKLKVTKEQPIRYELPLNDETLPLNSLLGKEISLKFSGQINCIACGRKTNKSYSQGYCFNCMRTLPECDMCIVKPEQCHYDEGTCRDPKWGDEHCMQPHYVYLANSSGIKVGITRAPQIPTRWIDQGALYALPIFRVASRYQSGVVEHMFKDHVADKTNWRKMLTNDVPEVDLESRRDELFETCAVEIREIQNRFGEENIELLRNEDVVSLDFPVLEYPDKVKSLNFDKTPEIAGTLQGIKGQYLILSSGVLNIRKFAGYEIEFSSS
jgi:hypothetical protein